MVAVECVGTLIPFVQRTIEENGFGEEENRKIGDDVSSGRPRVQVVVQEGRSDQLMVAEGEKFDLMVSELLDSSLLGGNDAHTPMFFP